MNKALFILMLVPLAIGCASGGPATRDETVRLLLNQPRGKVIGIALEQYVTGVVAREVPSDWPLEALKAQAVAARTYALYRKAHPRNDQYDLATDVSDQVYEKKRHYPSDVAKAVRETKAEILRFDGEILPAFFHSCCGGMSERGDRVWPDVSFPPLSQVREDPYCGSCPRAQWEVMVDRKELEEIMTANGVELKKDWMIRVDDRDDSGRAVEVVVSRAKSTKVLAKIQTNAFREWVGYDRIRSALFEMEDGEESLLFRGKGAGHGVGLCQWGARGMADEGKNYREILEFYYPGTEITSLNQQPAEILPSPLLPTESETLPIEVDPN